MRIRPFRSLKRWMPRTLLGRSLLILFLPMLIVQVVSAYVFFERHWDGMTRRLADATAGHVGALIEMAEERRLERTIVQELGFEQFSMLFTFEAKEHLHERNHGAFDVQRLQHDSIVRTVFQREFLARFLIEALQRKVTFPFHVKVRRTTIDIDVEAPSGVYHFHVARRDVFGNTTLIFILWSAGTALLFLLIAALFMRNQVRPIRQLAEVAEKFGKGYAKVAYKPSGAIEVRRAGLAFIIMRERIARQIKQRTEMLAGVSHDLRTPLTRMRLQLALMKDGTAATSLEKDVTEMEQMIQAYLAFAKGESSEDTVITNVSDLLTALVKKDFPAATCALPPTLTLAIRPAALTRALSNIIQNAHHYAQHLWVHASTYAHSIEIIFDDDGPGIPEDQYEDVFKPFYRVDESRNPKTGGSGLGLAIARDILRGHGGRITLDQSPQGGLRVSVRLPL